MNFYEELGVARSASPAQIQQAYKALVRILHPDQQQDENLKRLSELQLVRLNHIVNVLTDPLQRREYDLHLDRYLLPEPAPPIPRTVSDLKSVRVRVQIKPATVFWAMIAFILAISAVLWLHGPPAPTPIPEAVVLESAKPAVEHAAEPSTPTAPRASTPERQPDSTRPTEPEPVHRSLARARDPVNTRPAEIPTQKADSSSSWIAKAESRPDPPLAPVPVLNSADSAKTQSDQLPNAPAKVPASLSGKWLYAAQTEAGGNALYPPEYIEMRISSRAGTLRGKYYARYKVMDRALSPEVTFQFEGKPNEPISVLPWSSAYGSRGELRIKRISDESVEVTWITTVFGHADRLASGTAVLYRSDIQ